MFRGTTPTLNFVLPFDTSLIDKAYITIKSDDTEIEKAIEDCTLNEKEISVTLTQEETLQLPKSRRGEVQLRVLLKDGKALASGIYEVQVEKILKEGVI